MVSTAFYGSRGDIVNASILGVSLLYAGCVIYFTQPGRGFFDEAWKKEGFCIQNKHIPFWSSFDTCLYVDSFFSMVLGILYLSWRKVPGMERPSEIIPMVIMSTLGHGFAHGALAINFRKDNFNDFPKEGPTQHELWKLIAFATIFWFPLLKASMMKVASWKLAIAAGVVTYLGTFLREEYGFPYVQTILAIAFHSSQLMLPPKEKEYREYLMVPLQLAIPPLLTAWNEALFCEKFFRNLGGHVLYDASIILSAIWYYISCYQHVTRKNVNKQKLS